MQTVRVHRAALRHLDELVPLFLNYLEFYKVPPNSGKARRFLRDRLRRSESVIFLARLAGEPVGFVQLYPTFASLAQRRAWLLYDLFVAPGARRRGVATALLRRADRLGTVTGAAELVLETARSNRSAQRLYKRLGWERDEMFLVYRRRK